jgi:predicted nucleotidyltransferase
MEKGFAKRPSVVDIAVSWRDPMVNHNLTVPKQQIAAFCRRHHIRRLSFFGSVLREDFGPESDVDVLVEFEEGHIPGLSFFGMQSELSEILGRKVELHTPNFLSRYFRDRVLGEAEVQYGQR